MTQDDAKILAMISIFFIFIGFIGGMIYANTDQNEKQSNDNFCYGYTKDPFIQDVIFYDDINDIEIPNDLNGNAILIKSPFKVHRGVLD